MTAHNKQYSNLSLTSTFETLSYYYTLEGLLTKTMFYGLQARPADCTAEYAGLFATVFEQCHAYNNGQSFTFLQ